MKITILASFLLSLLFISAENISAQQIYKWVDEKGVVHFSDSPTTSSVKKEKDPPKENGLEVLKKLDEKGNTPGSRVEKTGDSIRIITSGSSGSGGGSRTTTTTTTGRT
ncbi:MAG: DUF4124 domain-containing protein [Deltaproteobacteria bacterium]|nr:DUF4124 domain-containing protein [Deltaproteobacteria bacterium]